MKYIMYYISMLHSNLLDGGSTNIRLSNSALDILVLDCARFGYYKNEKENISFIINRLIKELTIHRRDLHEELLIKNQNDNELVLKIENNIFNTYLTSLNFLADDSYVNIGYRPNKETMETLRLLFCELLEKYDMDFAPYLRSIIYEYCSRNDLQRELFINYSLVKRINNLIKKERVTTVVNDGIKNEIVLLGIEQTPQGYNYVLGISKDMSECFFLPLSKIELIDEGKETIRIENETFNKVIEAFYKFVEGTE